MDLDPRARGGGSAPAASREDHPEQPERSPRDRSLAFGRVGRDATAPAAHDEGGVRAVAAGATAAASSRSRVHACAREARRSLDRPGKEEACVMEALYPGALHSAISVPQLGRNRCVCRAALRFLISARGNPPRQAVDGRLGAPKPPFMAREQAPQGSKTPAPARSRGLTRRRRPGPPRSSGPWSCTPRPPPR